jgi:hypothetical protein
VRDDQARDLGHFPGPSRDHADDLGAAAAQLPLFQRQFVQSVMRAGMPG